MNYFLGCMHIMHITKQKGCITHRTTKKEKNAHTQTHTQYSNWFVFGGFLKFFFCSRRVSFASIAALWDHEHSHDGPHHHQTEDHGQGNQAAVLVQVHDRHAGGREMQHHEKYASRRSLHSFSFSLSSLFLRFSSSPFSFFSHKFITASWPKKPKTKSTSEKRKRTQKLPLGHDFLR